MSRAEKLAELRAAIEGQVQLKKYFLSFNQPEQRERQQNEAARLRSNAAKLMADADRIDAACAGWKKSYIAADERVTELRAELLEVEHADKLARLEELVDLVTEGAQ